MTTDSSIRTATATELAALRETHGPGLSDDELAKTAVPLGKIEVAPRAFQHRDGGYRPWDKDAHIEKLARDLRKQDGLFDPLRIYAIAGHRIVLDGHCRLMAYNHAEIDPDTPVPVEYFRGAFREAYAQPAVCNSKETLNLTHRERLEAAWSYVRFDENRGCYSLRDIERFTTISSSTAGNMRNELKNDQKYEFDPRAFSWHDFKRKRKAQRKVEDDWMEDRAQAWADRMRSALGNRPNVSPDVFFRALELVYGEIIPAEIPREWAEKAVAIEDYWEELESPTEDENFSF